MQYPIRLVSPLCICGVIRKVVMHDVCVMFPILVCRARFDHDLFWDSQVGKQAIS